MQELAVIEWSSRQNHSQSDVSASSTELESLQSYFLLIIRLTIILFAPSLTPILHACTDRRGASYQASVQSS